MAVLLGAACIGGAMGEGTSGETGVPGAELHRSWVENSGSAIGWDPAPAPVFLNPAADVDVVVVVVDGGRSQPGLAGPEAGRLALVLTAPT